MAQEKIEIVYKRLDEIFPDPKNPRRNDLAIVPVAHSIRNFGFKNPIIIDNDGQIVAGHTRYQAAKILKMESVPCIIADKLEDVQLKAFQLADNKTGEVAEWDNRLLNEELLDIGDAVDMKIFDIDSCFDTNGGSNTEPKEVTGAAVASDYISCPRCGLEFLKRDSGAQEVDVF